MRPLFALICLTAVAYAQSSTPVITSATPNPIDAGGPAFSLTVKVSPFVSGAVVRWSGTPLVTTYVDDNTVSATVPAGLIAICGKYSVTVTQNTAVSNSYAVIVNPVLKSLSPNVLPAGSGAVSVTASGLGFSSNVNLTLIASGSQAILATTYSGSTTLSASVPASALTGTYPVSLFVADPSTGAVSQTLPITLGFASIALIAPNTVYKGIASCVLVDPACFTLNVGGENFVPGAQVLWSGVPLTTRFNSSTFLSATVPAITVHDAEPANGAGIQVKNPGAATASNTLKITVLADPFGTTITSLNPPTALAGGPAVTLTVTGERFVKGSTVMWVRTPLTTTFVSSTQLTATIPVDLVAIEGSAPITVSTPGIALSNAVNFLVVTGFPTISINGISPTSAIAGGPAFTMTVNGDGFVPASQVTGLEGATTTYVSPKQLTVSVPASAIASVGSHVIQVVNPGGVVSPQAPVFTVKASTTPAASLASLSPSSAAPGGAAFTLTIAGAGFTANSTVQWNGAPLVTTFVSAGQLTAGVPALLIATAGTANVTVTGDGGPSNALVFTIARLGPGTSSAGIVNAASSLPAIAPGTLIAIYGSNLATAIAQADATPLPVLLGGTSVSINGTSAPLLYVSPGQVNAQVPYETKVGTAKLIVQSNGVPSPAVNFEVAATGPGVFTAQQSNHVLALNLADGTLNASQTPARVGQYVTAYLTGQGLVDPPATTGDVAPSSAPFPVPTASVVVKIGGQIASVPFAGLAPGFIGLLQMNVLIPDVPAGEQSFDVSIGGVAAASTVISIASK